MMAWYAICTASTRNEAFVPVISRFENFRRRNGSHKLPLFQRVLWWARQGLNLRPHPCEGCALPLSYAPADAVEGPLEGFVAVDKGGFQIIACSHDKR
jgi:hypothetical protein